MSPVLLVAIALSRCAETPTEEPPRPVFWPVPPDVPRFVYEATLRAPQDVEPPPRSVRAVVTGTQPRQQPSVLQKPQRVAAAGGRVYVTDTNSAAVHVFDAARRRYFQLGFRREGDLKAPMGIAIDDEGLVYVSDLGLKRVVVFDGLGLFMRFIGEPGVFRKPSGVAVAPDGEHIYVIDTGGLESNDHWLGVFSRAGKLIRRVGTRGRQPGEFNLPTDVGVAPDGTVYVLDAGNFRVQAFSPDGTFLRMWGEAGRGFGQFGRPRGLAVDQEGLVYVADSFFANVQVFDSEGQLLLPLGHRTTEPGRGNFLLISGLSVDETGRLYVLDQYFKKLDVIRKLTEKEGQALLDEVSG